MKLLDILNVKYESHIVIHDVPNKRYDFFSSYNGKNIFWNLMIWSTLRSSIFDKDKDLIYGKRADVIKIFTAIKLKCNTYRLETADKNQKSPVGRCVYLVLFIID